MTMAQVAKMWLQPQTCARCLKPFNRNLTLKYVRCLSSHVTTSSVNCQRKYWLTTKSPYVISNQRTFVTQARCFNNNANVQREPSLEPGGSELLMPEPDFDWQYICDPHNTEFIRQNIINRKGVGNIDSVIALWEELARKYSLNVKSAWADIKAAHKTQNGEFRKLYAELIRLASAIPNQTHPHAPIGDEDQNQVIEVVGTKPVFDFPPRTILQLGDKLDGLRTERVGHTTGQKSYYLTKDLARLEQALIGYTVDFLHTQGFTLMSVPDMLHPAIIEGCGFNTAGEHTQVYRLLPSRYGDICLSGTGEMALAGFFLNKQLRPEQLPKKVMTVSRCYRAEASESQKDMGIYRVHQFTKVEMFVLLSNESGNESEEMMADILNLQKAMFKDLGLHFRILDMASQELGAPAYRKYDIEAWMPALQFWGEISSTSNCTDFQSRRLGMKYWSEDQQSLQPVHTLNGTACAVPRMVLALLENGQQQDGSVTIPEALRPYMQGQDTMAVCGSPMQMKWIKYVKRRPAKDAS